MAKDDSDDTNSLSASKYFCYTSEIAYMSRLLRRYLVVYSQIIWNIADIRRKKNAICRYTPDILRVLADMLRIFVHYRMEYRRSANMGI
jgi:hypothetical protein